MRLIALHGFTGSGEDFDPFLGSLAIDVQAVDLMGHGSAPSPVDPKAYSMSSQVQRVRALMAEGPVVVLGYSMGGRIALRLSRWIGESLKGLILISTTPGLVDVVERSERIARDSVLARRIETEGVEWFAEYWSEQPMIRSQKGIESATRQRMQIRRRNNDPVGLANTLRGVGQGAVEPVWSSLQDIRVPTLLITGSEDAKYSDIGRRMAKKIPKAHHCIIPNVGHSPHLEAVDEVTDIINRFLESLNE